MRTSVIIATVVLSLLLVMTALRKLSHREDVVESYGRVGIPEEALNPLAGALIIASGGLLAGLWWPLAGLITAVGLAGYFVIAVIFHLRVGDYRNLATPLVYETLAMAVVVLQLADDV